ASCTRLPRSCAARRRRTSHPARRRGASATSRAERPSERSAAGPCRNHGLRPRFTLQSCATRTPLTRSREAGKESDEHARLRPHKGGPLSQAGISSEKVLLDGEAIHRSLTRIAHEIVEGNTDLERVALVGIHTRGVPLAQRLRHLIAELTGQEV